MQFELGLEGARQILEILLGYFIYLIREYLEYRRSRADLAYEFYFDPAAAFGDWGLMGCDSLC